MCALERFNMSRGNPTMQDFLALARELAREQRTVIGVFADPAFSGYETPQDLRPEHFLQTWGQRADVRVVLLDAEAVRSYSLLFKGRLDILVYPYGERYPMDAPPFYTGQTLQAFLKRGGALLTTGGVPFAQPVNADNQVVINNGDPNARLDLDPDRYDKWVAPLGIKYYVHPHVPPVTQVDTQYLPTLPHILDVDGCPLGIVVTNSAHEPEPQPPHGNVFPERYPVSQVIPLLWGTDRYGERLAVNALLIQNFETGSRRVHFAHESGKHPLSPGTPHFKQLMENLLRILTNKVMLKDVASQYACYRQGETVRVHAEVISYETQACEIELLLEIRAENQAPIHLSRAVTLRPRETTSLTWEWLPEAFAADEYTLTCSALAAGQKLSHAENGFVVWNDEVVQQGPCIRAKGTYLHIDDLSFVMGTNYYESTRGEIMWYRPNVQRIAADFRQMRSHGVTYIRPHYHHLKWFKDYLLFQHNKLFPFYQELETLESPLPDERAWRILDMFLYLSQKYGLVYGGDLFTLVPEEMGDPRGWFPLRESVYCEEKRAQQRAFLRQISTRYKDVPGISWDLWNEPVVPLEALRDWTADLRLVLEEGAQEPRLITVGGGTGESLGELVDYVAPHGGPRIVQTLLNQTERPMFVQEMHLDQPEDLASEQKQAEDLRLGVFSALAHGLCGVAPWSWSRQMRLWQDVYRHHHTFPMEKWDDRLGMHVHDDGTIKPAGQAFRDLATVLRTIPLQRFVWQEGTVLSEYGEVKIHLAGTSQQRGFALTHFSGTHCLAAVARTTFSWNDAWSLSGPGGSYVSIFAPRGEEIETASRVYAKSDQPGRLIFTGRPKPQCVSLVQCLPDGDSILEQLPATIHENTIMVSLAPTQQAYWIRFDWVTADGRSAASTPG